MEMAAPRGRVLFFGGLPKGTTHMRFPSNILHYQEVQVHGSYASRYRDQVQALDMLDRDMAASAGSSRGHLARQAPAAFDRIRAGDVLKVVVRAMTAVGQAAATHAAQLDPGTAARSAGERLPGEPELAREFGVSRATLRARSRCSRRTGSCGACTAPAPTSPAGRCCGTTSAQLRRDRRDRGDRPDPGTTERAVAEERAPAWVEEALGVAEAVVIRRVRTAGGAAPSVDLPVDCVRPGHAGGRRSRCTRPSATPSCTTASPRSRPVTADAVPGRLARHRGGAPLLELRQVDSDEADQAVAARRAPRGRRLRHHRLPPGPGVKRASDLVLGIDIGSRGRARRLLDATANCRRSRLRGLRRLATPRPGWAEQDPRAWLAALGRTVAEATAGVDRSRIAGALVRLAARRSGRASTAPASRCATR